VHEPHLADQAVFDAALDALVAQDQRLAPVLARSGRPALRRRAPGFAGLAGVVVAQQVSAAAARAIWAKLEATLGGPPSPQAVLAAGAETLRAAGLSAPKIRTLTGIAAALDRGEADLDALAGLPPEEAAARLVLLPGVGQWTADIYLLFCLGRADAFPSGDLALQVAAGEAFGLDGRMTALGLAAVAEDWRPFRGVAAHLLWAYHAAVRARPG